MAGDIESGNIQQYGTFASRGPAAPAHALAPAAVMGWGHRFANFFNNLTLRDKVKLAACGVGFVGAVGASIYGISYLANLSNHVVPSSADQICKALPKVAGKYIQWLSTPAITAFQANITQTMNGLCSGSHVTDPAALAAAQSTLETLRDNIANVSVNIFTGHYFHNHTFAKSDLPQNIFQYMSNCLSDPNVPEEHAWYYLQVYLPLLSADYYGLNLVTLDTLRKVALGGLSILCGRNNALEPTFYPSGYVCERSIIDDAIQYIANARYIWPS